MSYDEQQPVSAASHRQRPSRALPIIIGSVFVAVLVICGFALVSGNNGDDSQGEIVVPTVSASPGKAKAGVKGSPTPAAAPKATPVQIKSGTWEIPGDVKAGKYRTTGADGDNFIPLCTWSVHKGSETGEIVAAGSADEGEPGIVTLKKGHVFTTDGCEPWTPR